MKKTILWLVVLALPLAAGAAVSAGKAAVRPFDLPVLKLLKGEESGVRIGGEGVLLDSLGGEIGRCFVMESELASALAEVRLAPGRRMLDLTAVRMEKPALAGVPFRIEPNGTYLVLDRGRDHRVRTGMKGRLDSAAGELVGFFRVVSVEGGSCVAAVTSLARGMGPENAAVAKFQSYVEQILGSSSLLSFSYKNLIMIVVGLLFITIAIRKEYEPLLLVPIGFGILVGNIPLPTQLFNSLSVYMIDPLTREFVFNTTTNSVLGIIYQFVTSGVFPPLIFLGIGAMTDFSTLLSNPKTILLGAAAQVGIFATFLGALLLKFTPAQAASIGIIGGADGPTAIFLTSKLAPALIGPIAIAAYSYMGLVPIIQPPIMRLLTTNRERRIRMKPSRKVSRAEKIIFPIVAFLVTTVIAPGAIPLLGMLFFGNLLKESGVTGRLAKTASTALIDISTMLLGLVVGASTTAQVFLNTRSILIFVLGCASFAVATAGGVLFAKLMNLFLREDRKVNPLIGSAGVSAVPDSARVSEIVGRRYDPDNHLLMHAMGPNVAGVIGSAIAAGIMLGIF
jgi:sodium ion-translocating decarboxylase beta subunit